MKLLSPIPAFSFQVLFSFHDLWLNKLKLQASYWDDILSCIRNSQKGAYVHENILMHERYNCVCLKINRSGYSHCSLTSFSHLSSCVLYWAKHCVWEMSPEGFQDLRSLCGTLLLMRYTFGKYKQNQFSGTMEMVPVNGMNFCKA